MALTTQSMPGPNWDRWQHQVHHGYSPVESSHFMVHDRSHESAPLLRPMMVSHMMMTPQHYNPAPMQAMPAPQYGGHPDMSYGSYSSSPSTTIASPVRAPYMDRIESSVSTSHHHPIPHMLSLPGNGRPSPEYQASSPSSRSIRSDSRISAASSATSVSSASKTITVNKTLNPADQIQFKTDIDELMKTIQDKADDEKEQSSNEPSRLSRRRGERKTIIKTEPIPATLPKMKKYVCDGPNCNKRFSQKTHLDIHRRAHTGEKPYKCPWPGCGLTFSQRGNLKTHQRRHNEEKPYKCSLCTKTFAQRGNVRSHEKTHQGLKPFTCRLGNCGKVFSQLGNMKTHQNNFHKEILQELTAQFATFTMTGHVPETHRDIFEYFKEHYKNSNKGIKGRGKGRLVAPRRMKTSSESPKAESAQLCKDEFRVENSHGLLMDVARPQSDPYAMYHTGSGHPGSVTNMLYEHGQPRHLPFSGRFNYEI